MKKLKNALNTNDAAGEVVETVEDAPSADGIITTEDEMQAYYIVKSITAPQVDMSRITCKGTVCYFSILLGQRVTRWICRVFLKKNIKYLVVPEGDKAMKYSIETLNDIYSLSEKLIARLRKIGDVIKRV